MIERVECSSPNQFAPALAACEEAAGDRPLFVLFSGSKNASTGVSWCPDCVAADPIIDSVLQSLDGGCVLLACSVDREPYRTPDYAYRVDPNIKLTCVPTLMKWSRGKAIARLNDSQCQVREFVVDLVEA